MAAPALLARPAPDVDRADAPDAAATAPTAATAAGAASAEAPATPAPAALPPFVPMPPLRAAAYMAASVVLALAQGFGQNVVSANLQQLQGSFGATQAETTWLVAAYLAPNVSLTLALFKIRAQYGLRNFAEVAIVLFLLATLVNYVASDLLTNVVARFLAGCAAAPMSSLAFLYMLEPMPPARKMTVGLPLALTVIFAGGPVTRLVSPHLLDAGLWHGLTAMEVALALVGLGCVYLLPLASPPREKVIHAADVVSYLLIAIGFGAAAVALTLGATYWWLEAPWLGVLLAVAIGAVALAAAIELNRSHPLLDIRWIASPSILHFTFALLLFRIVLSEQAAGAPGLFRALGLQNEELSGLFGVILVASVLAGLLCAATMKHGREPLFHVVALVLVIAGALMDAGSTSQTRPGQMFVSQGMMAFASALFMPPAMLSGMTVALAKGRDYIFSFILVFLVTQKLGGSLGSAAFTTFVTWRQRLHAERLAEALQTTNPLVAERIAALGGAYGPVTADAAAARTEAVSALSGQVSLEATVLAYNDAFLVIAAIAAATLFALLVHIAAARVAAATATPVPARS